MNESYQLYLVECGLIRCVVYIFVAVTRPCKVFSCVNCQRDYSENMKDSHTPPYQFKNGRCCCLYCFKFPKDVLDINDDPTMTPLKSTKTFNLIFNYFYNNDDNINEYIDQIADNLVIQIPNITVCDVYYGVGYKILIYFPTNLYSLMNNLMHLMYYYPLGVI